MKIVLNIEKKHLYFLIGFVLLVGTGAVLASTWDNSQSHDTLWTTAIKGKNDLTIDVHDTLNILPGKALCLNNICNTVWPAGTVPVGWTEDVAGNKIYTTTTGRNVGIGTNAPLSKLDVSGQIRATSAYISAGPGLSSVVNVETYPDVFVFGVEQGTGKLKIKHGSIAGVYPGITMTSANSIYNVGIGTEAPTEKLDIVGNLKLTGHISFSAQKACSIAVPSNWRDTTIVPHSWTRQQCTDLRNVYDPSATYNLVCITSNGFEWGSDGGGIPPGNSCGW